MDRLMEGRTVVVIAHRLSTAERADRVGVVSGGRLVEVGTHDELVAHEGHYATLFATWSGATRPRPARGRGDRGLTSPQFGEIAEPARVIGWPSRRCSARPGRAK